MRVWRDRERYINVVVSVKPPSWGCVSWLFNGWEWEGRTRPVVKPMLW